MRYIDQVPTQRMIVGPYVGAYFIYPHCVNLPLSGKAADRITDAQVAECGEPGVRVVYARDGMSISEQLDDVYEAVIYQIENNSRLALSDISNIALSAKRKLNGVYGAGVQKIQKTAEAAYG